MIISYRPVAHVETETLLVIQVTDLAKTRGVLEAKNGLILMAMIANIMKILISVSTRVIYLEITA